MRALVRRLVTSNARFNIRAEWQQFRVRGPIGFLRWNAMLADAWMRDRINRRRYRLLAESELRAARKSDTVFIFGSGSSLNEITPEEWTFFRQHDVFGFNAFYHDRWIPVDFHLLRVGVYGDLRWRPFATEVSGILNSNPHFANTIFILQERYLAQFSNQLVGHRLLPRGARLFRYADARQDTPPTRSFKDGLRHTTGTLNDVVNCAFCIGWKDIVLVGVDLYDSRYFYLPPDQTVGIDASTGQVNSSEHNPYRGQRFDEPHNTLRAGAVDVMREWRSALERDGVRLSVYNPRSLLATVLPVYPRPGGHVEGTVQEASHV